MDGYKFIQQRLALLRNASIAGAAILGIHHACHAALLFQMINQAGNVRFTDQKQLAEIVKLHSLGGTMPQEH